MRIRRMAAWALAALALAAEAREPRLALLLSRDGRHHDEFDGALKTLGWPADRYPCDAASLKTLAARLGEYDLLLAAPLFDPGEPALLPGENRAAYLKFLENGGLLAVTDGSYPGVRRWLADISPDLGGVEPGSCNSSQWAVNGVTADAQPPHPLRFFPERIREPNSWPHFLPAKDGSKWRVVASCSEGFPVTFAQTVGKGLVSLSALRQPSAKQLGNFYACLQLSRAGLALQSFTMPEPAPGDGAIRLELAGAETAASCGFAYEIVPDHGEPQRFERQVSGAVFELPYHVSRRGPATARLLFTRGGQETALFSRRVDLPRLLTVTPGACRGILSTERRLPTVSFVIGLAPDRESLEGASVALEVLDALGNTVAVTNAARAAGAPLVYRQPVRLDRALKAGGYTVRATLAQGASTLAKDQAAFRILAPQPAQTVIDEDNTLLVNGHPFFPLGLYHVKPADYAEVAALGINTVQFWTWDAQPDNSGLSRAAEHGLKAVFELNHKSETIVRETVEKVGRHPALLMWYGLDEPAEGSYGQAEMLRDTFHACDDQHPVYTVSCRPDLFAEQSAFADVFAHDPYGKPQRAQDWMSRAAAAVDSRKPVICVPGVFGTETAEELRATAYLALAHDARGILWYPWCQAGGGPAGIGLKNSPAQQAVIRQLCAEIRALGPALTAPVRRSFQSDDAKLHGILCTGERRYLLLVNGTPEKIEAEAALPEEGNADAEWRDFFGKRKEPLTVRGGRLRVALEPYETRVYW